MADITKDDLKAAFAEALAESGLASRTSTRSRDTLSNNEDTFDFSSRRSNYEKPDFVKDIESLKEYSNVATGAFGVVGNVMTEGLTAQIEVINSMQESLERFRPEFHYLRNAVGGVSLAALEGKEAMGAYASSFLDGYENIARLASGAREATSAITLKDDPDLLDGVSPLEAIYTNAHEAAEDYVEMMTSISSQTANLAMKMTQDQREQALALKKTMKISDSDLTELLTRQYAFSGETGTKVIEDIANVSVALSKKVGIAQQSLQQDIIELKKDTKTFGDIGVDAAGRIAASLGQLGLDVQTFKGMVSGFLDFDSAASKMGELSALFGIQMDAMEMTYLANEDQEEFLQRMREQVLDSGVDVENMSNVRARALTEQLGLQSIEQMKMFMRTGEQPIDQAGLESITAQAESMDGMTTAFKEIGDTTAASKRTTKDIATNLEMQLAYTEGMRPIVAANQRDYEQMAHDIQKIELPESAMERFTKLSDQFRTNETIGTAAIKELVKLETETAQEYLDALSDSLNEVLGFGEAVGKSVIGSELGLDVNVDGDNISEAVGESVSYVIDENNRDIEEQISKLSEIDEKGKNELYEMIAKENNRTINEIAMELKGQKIEVTMTVDGETLTKSIIKQGGTAGNQRLAVVDQNEELLTSQRE